jgi:hypothetical protein
MGDRLYCGSDLLLEVDGQPFRGMLRELDLAYSGTPMEHILPLMLIADVFGDGKSVEESLSSMLRVAPSGCQDSLDALLGHRDACRCLFERIGKMVVGKRRKTTYRTIRRDCAKRNRHK